MNVDAPPRRSGIDANDAFAAMLAQVLARSPRSECLRHDGQSYTRAALAVAMQEQAEALAACKLQPGEPVTIEVSHSFDLVVAMCAVAYAGGLVVPVDPALPEERRRAIVEDVQPRLSIVPASHGTGTRIIEAGGRPALGPELAFLVYTSGSSGSPKGVEISKDGYLGRLDYITRNNPPQPGDVDLMWTPSSFIGMLDEVFFPLMLEVPIVIAPQQARTDPTAFADLVQAEKITTFRITPSLLNVFLTPATADRLTSVRAIYCSGETLGAEVQAKVHDLLDTTLIGFYGATEAPGVAYHVYDKTADLLSNSMCTPQPFANIQIVDDDGRPVEGGAPGEILVGGLAVADGYWNRPELSAEKFSARQGDRLYRTGDLGRWHPNGQFEVLGRADMAEVNLRGVRVALSDVCHGIRTLPDVTDAWVTAHSVEGQRDPTLVAHVVTSSKDGFSLKASRQALSRVIPAAAIPAHVLTHDSFPLTANGKLDIQALMGAGDAALTASKTGQATDAEVKITPQARAILPAVLNATQEVLGCSDLRGTEDFFDLGGDSLKAVELSLLINERLGANLASTAIFNSTSLNDIAEVLTHGHLVEAGPCRLLRDGRPELPPVFTINATGNYARLAKALTYEGAVYNLNIFGLTNRFLDRLDEVTLQDMARHLADEVRLHHPDGPWSVMAFCQDGCLAVEIGKILQQDPDGNCDLLLIDTFFTDHGPNLKMSIMRLLDFGPGYYLQGVKRRIGLGKGPERVDPQRGASPQQSAALFDKSKNDGRLYRRYSEFFMSYRPERHDGATYLFTSGEWRHANLRAVSRLAAGPLDVTTFSGLHGMIFADGHIHHLARAVDSTLKRAQRAAH